MWFFAFSRAVFTPFHWMSGKFCLLWLRARLHLSDMNIHPRHFKHWSSNTPSAHYSWSIAAASSFHSTRFPSVLMWYIFIPSSLYFSLPVSSFFCIFSFSSSMLPTWFIFFAPLHHVVFFSSFISSHCCSFTSPSLPFLLPCIFLHFFLLSLEPQFRKPIWSIRRWPVQQSGPRH